MTAKLKLAASTLILVLACGTADPVKSTKDLEFFVGSWKGESSFLPAFTPGAERRDASFTAECRYVLFQSYIQCDIVFRRPNGRERGVMALWNFDGVSGQYRGTTLSSNYGAKSNYSIAWDDQERAYVGYLPTKTADGRDATERLVFRLSEDGKQLTGLEMIRPDGQPDSDWIKTFEYVWHKDN
jgi:Protein of unknown function (DUF1579)